MNRQLCRQEATIVSGSPLQTADRAFCSGVILTPSTLTASPQVAYPADISLGQDLVTMQIRMRPLSTIHYTLQATVELLGTTI